MEYSREVIEFCEDRDVDVETLSLADCELIENDDADVCSDCRKVFALSDLHTCESCGNSKCKECYGDTDSELCSQCEEALTDDDF